MVRRKTLMHVAVVQGRGREQKLHGVSGLPFRLRVRHASDDPWVDLIRQHGNLATHRLPCNHARARPEHSDLHDAAAAPDRDRDGPQGEGLGHPYAIAKCRHWPAADFASMPTLRPILLGMPGACPIGRLTMGSGGQRRAASQRGDQQKRPVDGSPSAHIRQFLNHVSQVRFLPGHPGRDFRIDTSRLRWIEDRPWCPRDEHPPVLPSSQRVDFPVANGDGSGDAGGVASYSVDLLRRL